jgi:hypothetical protein
MYLARSILAVLFFFSSVGAVKAVFASEDSSSVVMKTETLPALHVGTFPLPLLFAPMRFAICKLNGKKLFRLERGIYETIPWSVQSLLGR